MPGREVTLNDGRKGIQLVEEGDPDFEMVTPRRRVTRGEAKRQRERIAEARRMEEEFEFVHASGGTAAESNTLASVPIQPAAVLPNDLVFEVEKTCLPADKDVPELNVLIDVGCEIFPKKGIANVVYLIDESTSMQGSLNGGDAPVSVVKQSVKRLHNGCNDNQNVTLKVAFGRFASDASMYEETSEYRRWMTLNNDAEGALDQVSNCIRAEGSTDISSGIKCAFDALKTAPPSDINHIVVLTDGNPMRGVMTPWAIDAFVTKQLEMNATPTVVHVMAIGNSINSSIASSIVNSTKGLFRHADRSASIDEALQAIQSVIRETVQPFVVDISRDDLPADKVLRFGLLTTSNSSGLAKIHIPAMKPGSFQLTASVAGLVSTAIDMKIVLPESVPTHQQLPPTLAAALDVERREREHAIELRDAMVRQGPIAAAMASDAFSRSIAADTPLNAKAAEKHSRRAQLFRRMTIPLQPPVVESNAGFSASWQSTDSNHRDEEMPVYRSLGSAVFQTPEHTGTGSLHQTTNAAELALDAVASQSAYY
jgi:hypothetical protein